MNSSFASPQEAHRFLGAIFIPEPSAFKGIGVICVLHLCPQIFYFFSSSPSSSASPTFLTSLLSPLRAGGSCLALSSRTFKKKGLSLVYFFFLSAMYRSLVVGQIRSTRPHQFNPRLLPCFNSLFHTSAAPMFALSKFRGNVADQPKTFSRQHELPRLPIPELEDTFARYIASLEPILLQAQAQGKLDGRETASSEIQRRKTWAKEALQKGTLIRKLQQRLIGKSICFGFFLLVGGT